MLIGCIVSFIVGVTVGILVIALCQINKINNNED